MWLLCILMRTLSVYFMKHKFVKKTPHRIFSVKAFSSHV
ncbi:hypothetical protein Lpp17_2299 [Lacticaseibacillus paracasei subsp. paracasei Lpp17]|nr:hypothetical protein Lpp17_2299 [Lacticaseibacillus paracasei subsp. paracasei Lpp17]